MELNLNEFIKKFSEALDVDSENEIVGNTIFHDLDEWTSLAGLSIMAMVDEEYDIQLKADEMRKANTIQELYDLVSSKL